MDPFDQTMAGVAIQLWSADADKPHLLATPFLHAATAAAMDATVEMYFTARSVRLLVPGAAQVLRVSEHSDQSILDLMREAVAQGARLLACADALHAAGIDTQSLIPECAGRGGSVQFMARVLDPRRRALVF
jgi:hypothetical protein